MSKRVELDGKTSDWYEKAVFILKDEHVNRRDINFIQCAEGIIENYMKTCVMPPKESIIEKQQNPNQKQGGYKWIDTFFITSLCALGITILFYFV